MIGEKRLRGEIVGSPLTPGSGPLKVEKNLGEVVAYLGNVHIITRKFCREAIAWVATNWEKISKRLRNGFSASKKISVCEVEIGKHHPAAGLDLNQILELSNVGKATAPSLVIMALLSIL